MEVELQEIKQLLKALVISQKETDTKFKESREELDTRFKETDTKFKESRDELDTRFKETDKRIKAAFDFFEGQWGKLMESLVEGDLIKILQSKGINVHDTSMRRKGNHEGKSFEFDIIAHNGGEIVIVEVKTTLKTQDVKNFLEKLKNAKLWLQEYSKYKIYGAVAYLRADSGSEIFAENERLFVIRATGNSSSIINQEGFIPKIF